MAGSGPAQVLGCYSLSRRTSPPCEMGSEVAQMDAWTKVAEITSEQKNFLLLSALHKIVFTRVCVHTCTRRHTWVCWAWSPESSTETGQRTRRLLRGGGSGVGPLPIQPFSGGWGQGAGRERLHIDGCWGAEEVARKMSLLGICSSNLVGVGTWCGQMVLPACRCGGTA